ncbi:MAG: calcium/sodium antiporter [Alphaproteobacteria bacterium]|nr:calcium/sodium antiporter [Alphaproteobacteria bacterium]
MLYVQIIFWIIVGFLLLMYGGNLLVDGSVAVAKKMRVSSLLIGLTLVGFGTSTPELMTSLSAVFQGNPGIGIGNVVGSNIANILLVLGVAAFLNPVIVSKKELKRDGLFLAISTLVLMAALWWGRIGRLAGLGMCGLLAYYVWYCYQTEKKGAAASEKSVGLKTNFTHYEQKELLMSTLKTIAGIVLTICGAYILVDNAVRLAHQLGVSPTIIGLTVVAIGTSLPELATSIVSSIKKQSALAYGNVVGSNIYNALFILGATAILRPVPVPTAKDSVSIDTLIMAIVTALLLGFGYRGKFSRTTGIVFLALYVVYVGYLYVR